MLISVRATGPRFRRSSRLDALDQGREPHPPPRVYPGRRSVVGLSPHNEKEDRRSRQVTTECQPRRVFTLAARRSAPARSAQAVRSAAGTAG
jgi:hypothetical protein